MKRLLLFLFLVVFLSSCATYIPAGALYTAGKMAVQATAGSEEKTGKACMTSILALIAIGDASVEAAKKAGDIKEVSSINYEVENILGVYGKYCTIVKGK